MREIDEAVTRLEQAAARLRTGELPPEEAATLVERCAELAADLGAELERQARSAPGAPVPGQEELI
jgi:exonuclease VII small subunit